jgi:drug/metabolite transporter (DMT)-like permease
MGVIYMLLASACFTTMAAMIKAIGPSVPIEQLVFIRCAMALPVLLLILFIKKQSFVANACKVMFFRSLLGMAAMYLFIYALTHMPLADCIFLGKTRPLIMAFLAPYVLKEKTPLVGWIAIIIGFSGVIMILKPAIAWPLAAWLAIAATALSAGSHLMVRRLNQTDDPLVITFYFTLFTALVTSVGAVPNTIYLAPDKWLLIAAVAFFASAGQLLMSIAYGHDKAPVIAAANYSSIILSLLYGYIFWEEIPEPLALVGGLVIVSSSLLLVIKRIKVKTSDICQ